jgi:hypothetical protein
MCVPDLSSDRRAGHIQRVPRILASALCAISSCLLLLCGCSSESDGDFSQSPGGHNPWVLGGQTGALMPACGLTPAARAGDSTPGGDTGIVIHTDACVGFAAAELELRDEDGVSVEFELETLPGGAKLLRPRIPLEAGIYHVTIAGIEMESVVAEEPAALPMQLGTLRPLGPKCGVDVELIVDPLLLPFLPQLKLSVSVDGRAEEMWFDYGTLEVTDERAVLSMPGCSGPQPCLSDGEHTLRVTAELAGELGTLAPVDVTLQTRCQNAEVAETAASDGDAASADCGVTPTRRSSAGGSALLGLGITVVLLAVRRARRSSA